MEIAAGVLSSLNILLVDDNAGDRALVRHLLPGDCNLRQASTAADARTALDVERPDIVLLDYRLPDAEGTSLLPMFGSEGIPVVMLTGLEAAEIVVQALHAGAHDYLVKNQLTAESLGRAILNAIEKARLRKAVEEQQLTLARQAAALEAKNREISQLAGALTLAEQEERRRLANLLHDHVQQLLFGAKLGLAGMADIEDRTEQQERIDHVEAILDEAIDTTRNLAVELTPPVMDREELAVGLAWVAARMKEQHGLHVELEASDDCRIPARELRVLLLQLVRELLFNVVKHAGVERAELRLAQSENSYAISVIDEGRGFDTSAILNSYYSESGDAVIPDAFGLYSVRERLELVGGRLDIDSQPGGGTCVTIRAPVDVGRRVPSSERDLFSQEA